MICKRCGSALPSEGVVCLQCGTMMSKEQLEEIKKWQEINKQNNNTGPKLMSSRYGVNKENFEYNTETKKENKLMAALALVGIVLIIIIVAIIKFLA